MKDQTKIIVGLLAGAAVVAAVGILLKSEKGNEIKEDISDYFADLIKSVKSKVQSTADDLSDYRDNAVKNARSIIKNKVDKATEAAISGN
ncbi:YtxH domain-containing protein [Mucilaginibacter sp. AW1-3]